MNPHVCKHCGWPSWNRVTCRWCGENPHVRTGDGPVKTAVCDASFRAPTAGLAVVGDFGEHTAVIDCATSVEGELRALLMALNLAVEDECAHALFYVDCQSAAQWWIGKLVQGGASGGEAEARSAVHALMKAHPEWEVIQIPRALTRDADRLAGMARIGALGKEHKKHRVRARKLALRTRLDRQRERENIAPKPLKPWERKQMTRGPRR